jgi:hypothetical protein
VILKFPRMTKLVSIVATVTIVGAACAGGGASGGPSIERLPGSGLCTPCHIDPFIANTHAWWLHFFAALTLWTHIRGCAYAGPDSD